MTHGSAAARSGRKLAVVAIVLAGFASGCQIKAEKVGEKTDAAPATAMDPVERGKGLVHTMGCNDCHTPLTMTDHGPAPDMTKFMSGHPADLKMPPPPQPVGPWIWFGAATNTAFAGPWGVSYAINLTPSSSGMAAWNEEIFIKSMRTGKHMGTSRPILPPMPWPAYAHASDEDLKALWAYLQTITPIDNLVPDAVVAEMMPPEGGGAAPPAGH